MIARVIITKLIEAHRPRDYPGAAAKLAAVCAVVLFEV
jgi:hypothetical protein